MRVVNCWAAAWVLGVALAPGAGATMVREMSTAELVSASALVIRAQCTTKESRWFDRDLFTEARFEVRETFKGASPSALTVLLPGGFDTSHVPPVQVIYAGAPEVQVGSEVLLFLLPASSLSGAFVVTGFAQGLFDLGPGGLTGASAVRNLSGITLVSPGGAGATGRSETVAAEALLAQVRELVAAQAKGGL